jgi:hypothetical protein
MKIFLFFIGLPLVAGSILSIRASAQTPGTPTAADRDGDGIDDRVEARLLARFRPYFLFSNDSGDENLAPADAAWYLARAELLATASEDEADKHRVVTNTALAADPNAVLVAAGPFGSSDVVANPQLSGYHINPIEHLKGQPDNAGRKGEPWDIVLAEKNTGLYGHVVPVKLAWPDNFDFGHIPQATDPGDVYYKIEYWQLFGYNDAHHDYIGNHEGDWASIQLLYDPRKDQIVAVYHFAHGILFRFNLDQARPATEYRLNEDGNVRELRGAGFTPNLTLSHLGSHFKIDQNKDQVDRAQNAILRLYQDPITHEYCHPVAYVSHGTHELFPSEFWSYYGDPNHNGKSYHYLTNTPPNLGEVRWPMTAGPSARVVLRYNGYWGTFSRYNTPPEGPPLHANWTWPADPQSISIRSQVGNHGF